MVIHRIVRGDNNDWDDPWHPRPADIIGKLWLHVDTERIAEVKP